LRLRYSRVLENLEGALAKLLFVLNAMLLALVPGFAFAQSGSGHTTMPVGNFGAASILPTEQAITPTAAPGSTIQVLSTGLRSDGNADAAQAVNTALSPDGTTLLVLASGWNKNNRRTDGTPVRFPTLDPITGAPVGSTNLSEWVFVYAVNSDGTVTKQQQINIPSTYSGLAWAPDGTRFYVSGGQDDRVYLYRSNGSQFIADVPFVLLGHNSNQTAPFPKVRSGLNLRRNRAQLLKKWSASKDNRQIGTGPRRL
jgi:hypothetical protein